MIGFLEAPTGRLGNVMIQYAFLRQLSRRAGVEYFHRKLPYSKYFENWSSHNISLKLMLSRKKQVDLGYIEQLGISEFIEEVKKSSVHYVIKPPVLGHLFEFPDDNPGNYYEIEDCYCTREYVDFCKHKNRDSAYKSQSENAEKVKVAIHYRGTDFASWNSKALMSMDYYIRAINFMEEEYKGVDVEYKLFTDDVESQTYKELIRYLSVHRKAYAEADSSRDMMLDMTDMAMCDAIISSPSTYAIIAGIIGKTDKKIVHCKDWVQYCAEEGEDFWIQVSERKIPYYNVCAIL